MNNRIHICPNGLRMACAESDGNVAYIGVLVSAGSRDDAKGLDGLAHFVEHTIFKGTRRRKGWQVSNRMELIGGELNAYTTKEYVMLYTNAPAGYEDRAFELLADLVENAQFPEADIDRERGVILEEIHSYRDNASYAVFDEFDELFYKSSELAHNILGYADTVDRIKREDASDFLRRYFTADNMVIYCVSPSPILRNTRLADRHFGKLKRVAERQQRKTPAVLPAFDETRHRDNHQANVLLGARTFDFHDERRYPLFLLCNLLGGGAMNSILNRELRERRGLVYTVECSSALYSDCGAFQIYFGSEPDDVERCTKIVRREIERLADSPLSDRKFAQARQQLCGQLLVSGDSRESCAMAMAKSLIKFGEVRDNRYTADQIMKLSPQDLRDVAALIADQTLSRLVIA